MSWSEVTKINSNLSKPLNEIPILQNNSVIKSVQRGWRTSGPIQPANNYGYTIDLAPVNPAKCVVFLNGNMVVASASAAHVPAYVVSLTETQLTLSASIAANVASDASKTSWQVVEFY